MARSPGFGSIACNYAPYSDSVSLRLPYTVKLATDNKSLTHYTKGTQSPGFKGSRRALKPVAYRFSRTCMRANRQPPNLLDSSDFTLLNIF